MKTTNKEYNAKLTLRHDLKVLREAAIQNEDYSMAYLCEIDLKKLASDFFDLLETIPASFFIGSRMYYSEVLKIGKSYFDNGRKMTKGSGYYSITEIDEITEEMNSAMMADMYYY